MSTISEFNCDVDAALGRAQKAWVDYNIKLALDYVNILQNRKDKSNLFKGQGN